MLESQELKMRRGETWRAKEKKTMARKRRRRRCVYYVSRYGKLMLSGGKVREVAARVM